MRPRGSNVSTGRGLAAYLQMGRCIMLAGALVLAASAARAQDQTAATPKGASSHVLISYGSLSGPVLPPSTISLLPWR